jgi:LysM repeat protein
MGQESTASRWRHNLLLPAAVIFTLIAALLLSSLDTLQTRIVPTLMARLPITLVATVVPSPTVRIIPTSTTIPTATPTTTPTAAPIPRAKPTATAVAILPVCGEVPETWVPYTVQLGDTLFFLSLSSGATIDEITRANCLEITNLVSGIRIYLPATPPQRVACGPPSHWVPYAVQRNDTMYSLATGRGTTVYAVMEANCLTSSRLVAGRVIYLPPLAATATLTPSATSPPTQVPPQVPSATPFPTSPPTATNTPVATATPTATPICLTPLPTGCQATLAGPPTTGSAGITAAWLGFGIILGLALVLEKPASKRRR